MSARSKKSSESPTLTLLPNMEKPMKLVGPWLSGFTRRTGITMKLLGIPFEHLDLNAYTEKEAVRRYSPMGKVPALVLDNEEVLIDSAGIIDVLHERVGPEKALIPPSGAARRRALRLIGIGLNIYPKLTALFDESLRPENYRLKAAIDGFAEQATIGLQLLEAIVSEGIKVTFGFVTTEVTPEMRVKATAAGAKFLIAKPFTPESFKEQLGAHIR